MKIAAASSRGSARPGRGSRGGPAQEPAAWAQGLGHVRQRNWHAARAAFELAVRRMAGDAECWLLLANARRKCGDFAAAVQAVDEALHLCPEHAVALNLKIACLRELGRQDEILQTLKALPANALDRGLRITLVETALQQGQPVEAVQVCLDGLTVCPHDAPLNYLLGVGFADLGMMSQAAECFRTALQLDLGPSEMGVRDTLAFYERGTCDWAAAQPQVQRMGEAIARLEPGQMVRTAPFAHATLLDDPALLLRAARACARYFESGLLRLPPRPALPRGKLRVGYVSADFHRHATSYLMIDLLEQHDKSRFEVYLYSLGLDDACALRRRIEAAAHGFADVRHLTAGAIARRIRDDGIDILVDLKGYTRDSRPAIFAYRPAPVQVAYLGFPGTSGADFIDYIVGDPWVTPLEHESWYSEKIAQLPVCYQCNDGSRPLPAPASRSEHGLPEGALVLCGFNESYKISPAVFDVWCRLLQALPQAVLWLLHCNEAATAALRREALTRGVDPARLVFATKVDQAAHLSRIGCADLFLDTWPCNGHTTVSDMLWAGVPVVTFSGRTFASRVAGSLLHAVGLPELVCADVSTYEHLVVDLAADPARLALLRHRTREARLHAELFSGAAAARHLEALFERMWARALDGLPPEHLAARAA